MNRCFCYCRQSVGDSEESLSIDVQEAECKKLCESRGMTVVETFKDLNASGRLYPSGFEAMAAMDATYQAWTREVGKQGKFRDSFGKMLNRISEVDAVVCYDQTRLHRSLNGSFLGTLVSQQLTSRGVKLITVKEGEIDFGKFQDYLVNSLTSQINSEQLNLCRQKAISSLKRLKDTGEWDSSCLSFGYRGTGRSHEVEIIPSRAEVVRRVFQMYLDGKKLSEIVAECQPLMADDKKAYRLHRSQLEAILRKPIYCGYWPDSEGKLVKAKPIQGKELVTFEDFSRVQKLLSLAAKAPKREKKNWLPLSGKVKCGYCGSRMGFHPLRGTIDLRCPRHAGSGGAIASCKNGIDWLKLADVLWPLLSYWLAEKLRASQASSKTKAEMEKAEVSLQSLRQKAQKLSQMFMDDLMTQDAYEASMKELRSREKELQASLDLLKENLKAEYSNVRFFEDMRRVDNQKLPRGEADEAFKRLFKEVRIFHDRCEVDLQAVGTFSIPLRKKGHVKVLPEVAVCYTEAEGKWTKELTYYFREDYPDGLTGLEEAETILEAEGVKTEKLSC